MPVTNDYIDCKECYFGTTNQDTLDLHYQQAHGPTHVRQVEDSEDEAAQMDMGCRELKCELAEVPTLDNMGGMEKWWRNSLSQVR